MRVRLFLLFVLRVIRLILSQPHTGQRMPSGQRIPSR